MALADFQTALGRLVRAPDGGDPLRGLSLTGREQSSLAALARTSGFRATVAIQRSWCEGRAAKTAYLTLSLLEETHRKRLLEEWTNSGAGTSSFVEVEGDAFLEFLGARLDDPSLALTICRIERATLRANQGAQSFATPELSRLADTAWVVRSDRFAAVIACDTDPEFLLFGPGLDGLWRPASREEAALWDRLSKPVLVRNIAEWRSALEPLMEAGGVEFAPGR
jgi:hypothetical protein